MPSSLSRILLCVLCVSAANTSADDKPVPKLQLLPQPYDQAAFVRDDTEIARYHFGPALRRPFVFPLVGPAGRSLTRMGHPHDPQSHSHHNSVWVAHHSVNGVSFWDDRAKGRIVHQRLDRYEDLGEESSVAVTNHWIDEGKNNQVLMIERRRTTLQLLPGDELLLTLDLQLSAPPSAPVTLGDTPFGIVGVRMAKTIGVNDGGGEIRNSDGKAGEKEIFRLPAKWVDYSGPIRPGVTEGITLFDHPANPGHPAPFHVRADGWMGACLTHGAARVIEPGKPLQLRYALYVHAGKPATETLAARWAQFAKTELPDLNPSAKK
ncbi:MAG: PmoA family protein [Phycisphaerae bacterium]|nr:PmoA family protein [Tepidisphaeraceae bacterium]